MSTTAEKYIRINRFGVSPSGKTQVWSVVNIRSNEECGRIRWYGGFRAYVFYPTDGFLFDHECLMAIAAHLLIANQSYRLAKREAKHADLKAR